jgi:hypothetical protein
LSKAEVERVNLEGYIVENSFARENAFGGGVLIFSRFLTSAHKIISIPAINDLLMKKEFECCISFFRIFNFQFVLVGIFRSPISDVKIFLNKLDALIQILTKKYKHIVIAGDLNINILKTTKISTSLKNVLQVHGFKFMVDFPTRVDGSSCSAIDNVLTNIDDGMLKITGLITELSDHDGQLLEIANDIHRKQTFI